MEEHSSTKAKIQVRVLVGVFVRCVAQLVERWSPKPKVESSNPSAPVNPPE